MRWPLSLHVAVVLSLSALAAVIVAAALWLLLGMPRLHVAGPLKPGDVFDGIKIVLTIVAGAGGVVALVVAYRRQHLNEASEERDHGRSFTDRFGAAADQLGADQPTARMAGAYAMARLADEWRHERQTCIDVLCGYLRMPHAPNPPAEEPGLTAWQREREIRKTVLRLISAHLRGDSPESWQGYDLDFTGAVLDEADFRGARFTGGDIIFIKALFVGHDRDQVVFDEVEFADGSYVYFRLAEFRSGSVRFDRAVFSGGWVTFDSTRFTGARVNFRDASFIAGEVRFEDAEFCDGLVDFSGSTFAGTRMGFGEHHLESLHVTAPPARFTGGTVDLSRTATFTHPPHFGLQTAPQGLLLPPGTRICDLP
ncbi:pentapeptide repeat-containing protein [Streptomyces sp. NPDC002138]|uniref:pentapeptide repeat-containing protein n=1 Tax=Streptomyces sp. NPDC002138 TaxID=3154410 RepID=UPI003320BBD6